MADGEDRVVDVGSLEFSDFAAKQVIDYKNKGEAQTGHRMGLQRKIMKDEALRDRPAFGR
jgi:hypothetical protein